MSLLESNFDTAMADAFSKINIAEVKLIKNELDNGLTNEIVNTINISHHAKERCKERLNTKNDTESDILIRDYLRKASYIGVYPTVEGEESHFYSYNSVGVHLNLERTNVNTIVVYGKNYISEVFQFVEEVKECMLEAQTKYMKKLSRTRNSLKRKAVEEELDTRIEIAELERKIYKTKSEKARVRYEQRKAELLVQLSEQQKLLRELERKIRKVGGSLAYLQK